MGARGSSVCTASARGAMSRRIDPSWFHSVIFIFQPVPHDWNNKGRGMHDGRYKRFLAANRKE